MHARRRTVCRWTWRRTRAPSPTACATRCAVRPRSRPTCFTENRATLHLHGGITPWISDGTPHQWITPGRREHRLPEGRQRAATCPTCPIPGPGAQTFFYTNQQSARLMFYHDHAWGITRLNVYAGEAAGYLLTDATEQSPDRAPAAPSTGLGVGDPADHPGQDLRARRRNDRARPTRPGTTAKWGGEGSLWIAARLHAGPEPGRPVGHERLRPVDVRPVVLAARQGRQVPADRQPVLRPDLRSRTSRGRSASRR